MPFRKKALSGISSCLPCDDLLEAADRLGDRHVRARGAGELFGDEERLREEALDLARALDGQLVLVGELVDAEDRDDVLQLLVALQDLLDFVGHAEVVIAEDVGLEDRGGRVERVDGRVDAFFGDRAGQGGSRVEVGEDGRGGRVGVVIGGHVDRLDRGDGSALGRGDALLQLAHLGLQRRLVTNLRGHPPEQRGDLGAGLDEAKDVVDEQQHVLTLVAEVFGHRQAGEGDAHARAGRLVHLAEYEHRLVEHARLLHLQPQVVALTRALADAAERRQAAVLLGEVVDQLLDQDGLADARATEQPDLAALGVRGEQVDDLDARLEHLRCRRQILDARGVLVDATARRVGRQRLAEVDRLAEQVEDPTERDLAHGHGDRATRVDHLGAARQAVGRVHRDGAHAVVTEMLLDLAHEHAFACAGADALGLLLRCGGGASDGDRVVDLRQALGEDGLDHDALDLLDTPDVLLGGGSVPRRLRGGRICGDAGIHLCSILLFFIYSRFGVRSGTTAPLAGCLS